MSLYSAKQLMEVGRELDRLAGATKKYQGAGSGDDAEQALLSYATEHIGEILYALGLAAGYIERRAESEAMFDVAKKVTIEAGFPWTDPRTGETHKP